MEDLKINVELRKTPKEENPEFVGYANITLGDLVLKGVAITEKATEKGTITNFQIPLADKYENKDGEIKYIHTADITSKDDEIKSKVTKAIRSAIISALTNENTNERGNYVGTKVVEGVYDKDFIKAYVKPINSENYPGLKANANLYVGGIIKLNNIKLTEYVNQEGETKQAINVPNRKYEQDGETKYDDRVIFLNGLRDKVKSAIETEYLKELEKEEAPEQIEPQEETEDEEEDER